MDLFSRWQALKWLKNSQRIPSRRDDLLIVLGMGDPSLRHYNLKDKPQAVQWCPRPLLHWEKLFVTWLFENHQGCDLRGHWNRKHQAGQGQIQGPLPIFPFGIKSSILSQVGIPQKQILRWLVKDKLLIWDVISRKPGGKGRKGSQCSVFTSRSHCGSILLRAWGIT